MPLRAGYGKPDGLRDQGGLAGDCRLWGVVEALRKVTSSLTNPSDRKSHDSSVEVLLGLLHLEHQRIEELALLRGRELM